MSSPGSLRSDAEQFRPRKRQRIERACARCKARKIKCDAKQPACSKCETVDVECVYGEVGRRGKGKTKAHVQALEERLAKMEALIVVPETRSPASIPGDPADFVEPTATSYVYANDGVITDPSISAIDIGTWASSVPSAPANRLIVESETLLSSLSPNLPGSHLNKSYVDYLRANPVQRLPRMQIFMPILPTVEIFTIVEIYLTDINAFIPIFHPRSLRILCHRGVTNGKPDTLWWACMNIIIATTIQSRSTDDGFAKVSESSWAFFKNAFSVYDDIVTSEPSILGLQVLLVMVLYMGRAADSKLTLLISSTCVHMVRIMGLDKKLETVDMCHDEIEQRRRLIWITSTIDTLLRIKAGEPLLLSVDSIMVGMPEQTPADQLGCFKISDSGQTINLLHLMVEISVIRSEVYSYLTTSTPQMLQSSITQDLVSSAEARISSWTTRLPIDYRPGGTKIVFELPVLVLHLAYHDCMALICTLTSQSACFQESISMDNAGTPYWRSESMNIRDRRVKLSRSVLDLIQSCHAIPFVYLWNLLQDMLAATLELTSSVLALPVSDHALANVKAISSFVRFLETLKHNKGCDVTRLLDGCSIMERVVKAAVLEEQSAHTEAVQLLLDCSPGHRVLAQALMTNLPKLDTMCQAAAANVFAQSGQRISNQPLLAPDCLMPSTYNFGPDPDERSVVDAMRAVYSDVEHA